MTDREKRMIGAMVGALKIKSGVVYEP